MSNSLPNKTKLFWSLGASVPSVAILASFPITIMSFTRGLGIEVRHVGLAVAGAAILSGLFILVFAPLTDHIRSALGRRHAVLYPTIFVAAASIYLLLNPAQFLGEKGMAIGVFIFASMLHASLRLFSNQHTALTYEIALDYHERTILVTLRSFVTSLTGAGLGLMLLRFHIPFDVNPEVGNTLQYMGIGGALFILIFGLGATHYTRKFVPTLHRPVGTLDGRIVRVKRVLGALGNRNLGILSLALFFVTIAPSLMVASQYHLRIFFWELSANSILATAISVILGGFLGFSMVPVVSRRIEKHVAVSRMLSLWCVMALFPLGLGLIGLRGHSGDGALILVGIVFPFFSAGLGAGFLVFLWSMLGDVIDEIKVTSGQHLESTIVLVLGVPASFGVGIANSIAGVMFDLVIFPKSTVPGEVDATVLNLLAAGLILIILVFVGLAILVLRKYSIDQEAHEINVAKLRHASLNMEPETGAGMKTM